MISGELKQQIAAGTKQFIEDYIAGRNTQTPQEYGEELHKIIESCTRGINLFIRLDLTKPDKGLDETQFEAFQAWANAEPTPEAYKHHFRTPATGPKN